MSPEKKPNDNQMNSAVEQDYRNIAIWLGIPVAVSAALFLTDCGLDKLEQMSLVRHTREKAELVAKNPCKVDSFSPRERFQFPSQRKVEYLCDTTEVSCEPNSVDGEMACRIIGKAEHLSREFKKIKEEYKEYKKSKRGLAERLTDLFH